MSKTHYFALFILQGGSMHITELRKGPHLSATAINDYLDFGLLYKLARIDGRKPNFIPDALSVWSKDTPRL
jgi:hypothetical protein